MQTRVSLGAQASIARANDRPAVRRNREFRMASAGSQFNWNLSNHHEPSGRLGSDQSQTFKMIFINSEIKKFQSVINTGRKSKLIVCTVREAPCSRNGTVRTVGTARTARTVGTVRIVGTVKTKQSKRQPETACNYEILR